MHAAADDCLPCSIPLEFRRWFMESESICHALIDPFTFGEDAHVNGIQCFFTESKPPASLEWEASYRADEDTAKIRCMLEKTKPDDIKEEDIKTVNMSYRDHLRKGRIQNLNGRLVLMKPILMNTKHVALIIVPQELRRKIFSHFHAGPSGGHMGEYKTLFRLRLRFFWPRMRANIKEWTIGCAHCQAYNIWRSRKSELYFSWPVTVPFWIMHVDLWSPGHAVANSTSSGKQRNAHLMNSMCDLTQFVISSVTYDITALELSQKFMSDVVLSFGMCAVLVIDEGSNFKGVFQEMCSILKITCWPLSRGNHKGLSVERYHRFLNKTQAIAGGDRGTHEVFIQNAKTSQYAWNSAPIDDTDITRSMAAVGRDFRFPLDVELSGNPVLNDSTNNALFTYLRNVSNDSIFAQSIVKVLIEERRARHMERHNKTKTPPVFKVGDVVKAHVQVKSNKTLGEVGKLSYKARGPFQITKDLGHNSYEVRRYNDQNSATRKYKATELYLLPPAIFPAEPLDTMDQRFLNYEHAPITSPLQKALKIELYNDQYYTKPPPKTQPSLDTEGTALDKVALQPHQFPTVKELHDSTDTKPPTPEENNTCVKTQSDSTSIHNLINETNQHLFFIKYTPEDTLRPRWFLIEVDLEATQESNPHYLTNGRYYCAFLAKHRLDSNKSDELSRWWHDWYTYTICPKTNAIVYQKRVAFPPHQTPDSTRYIEWADEVNLMDKGTILHGPFAFQPLTETNRTHSKVSHLDWKKLYTECLNRNILPPTLGSTLHHKPALRPSKKRKAL